ncbi:MAG: DegT/DnrJ/EryC1/StrS aminotransferase family protein [Desulfobacteraceae bacterium]|nr:DegT/DnrJ/EryC1/StrS aminotransferase family protein [Desulfobacteraceae bacterium]
MRIPFAKIDCSGNEKAYVQSVLDSGWLTTAGRAFEFEKRFGEAVGAEFACAVNSCTAALHLGLDAMGVGPGDKVLVQSMTFTASAEIIRYLGADPVFLDCDPQSRLVTPENVEDAVRRHPEAKVLIVVHFGGQAAQMAEGNGRPGILSVCRKHGLKILEDAAHAFPTRHGGKMIGSFGDVTCFSFYANKTITTGEGGMLVTDDESVWERAKAMRLHGINRDIWDRYSSTKPNWEYDVIAPGFKYNMPDVNAAIGLAQLERAEELRKAREKCCRYYHEHLAGIGCLELPEIRCAWEDHACHLYPVIVKDNAPVLRNEFIEAMGDQGVGTSVHYKPLHRMSYYRDLYDLNPDDFPNTEYIWKGTVSLPVYPGLSEEALEYICSAVKQVLRA